MNSSGAHGRKRFPLSVPLSLLVLGLGSLAAQVRADSLWTNPGSGDWFAPANWSGGVPTSSTNAFIDNGGTALISSGNAAAIALTVGQTAAFSTNTLSMTGGGLSLTSGLILGDQTDSFGQAAISAGAVTTSGPVTVGNNGSGLVNVTNGGRVTVNGGDVNLGLDATGTGTISVSGTGSTWSMANTNSGLFVGNGGVGIMSVTAGGAATINGPVDVGDGLSGTVNVSGGGSTWVMANANSGLYLGNGGQAIMNVTSGGAVTVSGPSVYLGTSSSGTVNVSGTNSTWKMTNGGGYLYVGYNGPGLLNVTNGGAVTFSGLGVYLGASSDGTVNVSGPGAGWVISNTSGGLDVGNGGVGIVNITGGGSVTNNGWAYVGDLSSGTVNVSGPGSTWVMPNSNGELFVGTYDVGILNITNGGRMSCATNAYLGYSPGSSGTVYVSDTNSIWSVGGSVFVGGSATAAGDAALVTVGTGATVNVTNNITIWSPGTVNLQGGQVNAPLVQLDGGTIAGWGTLTPAVTTSGGGGGGGGGGGTFNASDVSTALTLTGAITNTTNQTLTKIGAGTLVIAGTQWHYLGSSFYANAGMTRMNSDAGGSLGTTPNLSLHTANAGTTVNFGATQHLHLLDVGTNTTVSMDTNGGRVIVTDALTLAGGSTNTPAGTVQLHDNSLIVHGGSGGGDLLAIRAQIKTARNGGAWHQPGITTDLSTNIPGKTTTLAYALGSDTNLAISSLHGQAIAPTDVVVKYTYAGDANLDGSVDGLDIAIWAVNFTGALGLSPTADPAKTWTQGDWNFDGSVDGLDAAIWAANFTGAMGGGGLAGMVVDAPGANPQAASILEGMGITVVPEPASLVLLGLSGLVQLHRRRVDRPARR